MPHVVIKYAHVLICISAGEVPGTLVHFILDGLCLSEFGYLGGCCYDSPSRNCTVNDCSCSAECFANNDCCPDINDIGCYAHVSTSSALNVGTRTSTTAITSTLTVAPTSKPGKTLEWMCLY